MLFIDYGNRVYAPKTEMIKSKTTLWSLPPMAKPFKIIGMLKIYRYQGQKSPVSSPVCEYTGKKFMNES